MRAWRSTSGPPNLQAHAQPGARGSPLPLDGALRKIEELGHLAHLEAAEETQLDDATLALVGRAQLGQGLIEIEHLGRVLGTPGEGLVEGDPQAAAAALETTLRARMVDQYLAHRLGGQREEVLAIAPAVALAAEELEEGLVDQRSGLES